MTRSNNVNSFCASNHQHDAMLWNEETRRETQERRDFEVAKVEEIPIIRFPSTTTNFKKKKNNKLGNITTFFHIINLVSKIIFYYQQNVCDYYYYWCR